MAEKEYTQKFCPICSRVVRAERHGTNHVLHLLLSVFTLGMWIPFWSLASIKIGGWQCPNCGAVKLGKVSRIEGYQTGAK